MITLRTGLTRVVIGIVDEWEDKNFVCSWYACATGGGAQRGSRTSLMTGVAGGKVHVAAAIVTNWTVFAIAAVLTRVACVII